MRVRWFAVFYCAIALAAGLAHAEVVFSIGINEEFPHRQRLRGWTTTARVIEITLREWYGAAQQGSLLKNGSPGDWAVFLRDAPGAKPGRLSILYLASHQTAAGEWEFKGREQVRWQQMLQRTGRTAPAPSLVILDACYAHAAAPQEGWSRFAPQSLFASAEDEPEFELRFDRSRPFDAPRRYPQARDWLRAKLGKKWDGRISFLGLMWTQAFLETPTAPRSAKEWDAFLKRVADLSADFKARQSKRYGSTIIFAKGK